MHNGPAVFAGGYTSLERPWGECNPHARIIDWAIIDMRQIRALSIRQPWAALLVAGLKTIEVRSWWTGHRGLVLIHASKIPDPRPEIWAKLPGSFQDLARLRGGIIGQATLTNCRVYAFASDFAADVKWHLNDADWFEPPRLYGFEFAHPEVLPFRECRGQTRFFTVSEGQA
jgi:hypothetical protein